ncbi:MAG: hypothetical protein OWQ54_08800 [Sulfolobaceae archaeon]|nr:hypothetical protein [Sulfolobaceae archaeon]
MYEISKFLYVLSIIIAIILFIGSVLAFFHAFLTIFSPLIALGSFTLSFLFFLGAIWWGITAFFTSKRSIIGYIMYFLGTIPLLLIFPIGTVVGIIIILLLIFSKDVRKWYRL